MLNVLISLGFYVTNMSLIRNSLNVKVTDIIYSR